MPDWSLESKEFASIAAEILNSGHQLRFEARGGSMRPFIVNKDIVIIRPVNLASLQLFDVVLYRTENGRFLVHRIVRWVETSQSTRILIQGDANTCPDGWADPIQVLGKLHTIERNGHRILVNTPISRLSAAAWLTIRPLHPFLLFIGGNIFHTIQKLVSLIR